MPRSVIVWDQKCDPPDAIGAVLCWQSYSCGDLVSSVPRYLEDHAERLKAKYLAFVHDLGESRIHGKRLIEHLDIGDGFSLWWMTRLAEKSPLKSSGIYQCLRLLALEELLLEMKPSDLTLHSSDRHLAQAINRLCRNLKLEFIWRQTTQSKQKWSLRRIYKWLPFPVQGLITLRHIVLRWPLRRLQKPQWFSGENAIFLCSYFIHLDLAACARGQFYSRQWGTLPRYLHNSGRRTNWVHHFLPNSVVPDTRTGVTWLRKFNSDAEQQGSHIFLEAYLTWSMVGKVLGKWFRMILITWRLRHVRFAFYPRESAIWLWPILRNDWLISMIGPVAISNCLWVELFGAAMKDIPPQKRGLYLCENQGWERAFLHAWRKNGHGEIIGVPHATVPFWHLYYFDDPRSLSSNQDCAMPLPDRLAVNGTVAWRAFAEAGYPAAQLAEVEALRYLNLSEIAKKRKMKFEKYAISKPRTAKSSEVNVLILGDMVAESMDSLLRIVEEAIKRLPPGYKFTFKPHPGYAANIAEYPGLRADQTTEALDRILSEYDLAVAANSTSASVDAYLAGVPVIIGLDGADLNLNPLRGQSDVRFVSTPGELVDALLAISEGGGGDLYQNEFFFLNPKLPRWKRLLSSASLA